jgi:biopolymer transport protein ExbD
MRFKRHLEIEHGLKAIDVVALINVLFLLLIFLMLAPIFIVRSGISVSLPTALTSEAVSSENIEIIITKDNAVYLNNLAVSLPELKDFLRDFSKRSGSVLIKADKAAALGMAVKIWDLCRQQSITRINIATDQE